MVYTKENKNELIGLTFADVSCNGFFCNDELLSRKIEAIGDDWIIVRDENGLVDFASFDKGWQLNTMYDLINKWLGY